MSTKLPSQLTPFATNHPASSAYRITLSPYEWTWTQAEQEAMADAVVRMDGERADLRAVLDRALRALTAINAGFGKAQRDHIIAEGRKLLD